jgi:hypothetical protein
LSNSGDSSKEQRYCSILATSPAEFFNTGTIVAGNNIQFNKEFVIAREARRQQEGLQYSRNNSVTLTTMW